MTKILSLAAALALAACGGGTAKPATTTATTEPEAAQAAPAGSFELGELKFYEGDDLGLQLHANGHVEVKLTHSEAGKPAEETWTDVGSFAADGTISSADGAKHGKANPDGTFVGAQGQTAPFHLEGEALVVADTKITIDDKGIVQGGNDGGKQLRIEGATTPGLKRTALVVLAVMLSGEQQPAPLAGGAH